MKSLWVLHVLLAAQIVGGFDETQDPPLQKPQGWGTLRVFVICEQERPRLHSVGMRCRLTKL